MGCEIAVSLGDAGSPALVTPGAGNDRANAGLAGRRGALAVGHEAGALARCDTARDGLLRVRWPRYRLDGHRSGHAEQPCPPS